MLQIAQSSSLGLSTNPEIPGQLGLDKREPTSSAPDLKVYRGHLPGECKLTPKDRKKSINLI